MHGLEKLTQDVVHTPWISLLSLKKVSPTFFPVNSPTISFIDRQFTFVSALPGEFFINILIGFKAYDEAVSVCMPFLQYGCEILSKALLWTCHIFLLGDIETPVLLL